MPNAAAERQRRYRQRKAAQRAVLTVEVDLFPITELLVAKGFLQQWDADDKTRVAEALETAIDVWGRYA
jgi:hypothetical protein